MAGEGQAKPELSGREIHTAGQGKDIALQALPSQSISPTYSLLPALVLTIFGNAISLTLKATLIFAPDISFINMRVVQRKSCTPLIIPLSDLFLPDQLIFDTFGI